MVSNVSKVVHICTHMYVYVVQARGRKSSRSLFSMHRPISLSFQDIVVT